MFNVTRVLFVDRVTRIVYSLLTFALVTLIDGGQQPSAQAAASTWFDEPGSTRNQQVYEAWKKKKGNDLVLLVMGEVETVDAQGQSKLEGVEFQCIRRIEVISPDPLLMQIDKSRVYQLRVDPPTKWVNAAETYTLTVGYQFGEVPNSGIPLPKEIARALPVGLAGHWQRNQGPRGTTVDFPGVKFKEMDIVRGTMRLRYEGPFNATETDARGESKSFSGTIKVTLWQNGEVLDDGSVKHVGYNLVTLLSTDSESTSWSPPKEQ